MILHPAILALLLLSAVASGMMLYAAWFAAVIVRKWDLRSGSELQLGLERRTYLISTILGYLFAFQLLSPFLYVFTADRLCPLFTGAMCAAGTLNANAFGYPTLLLKLLNCVLAGVWLILNYTDSQARDYPLIRKKYGLLLAMTPLVLADALAQGSFFLGLKADVITSCCGTLFSSEGRGLASDLAAAPLGPTQVAFFVTLGATAILGFVSNRRAGLRYWFSGCSVASFVLGIVAVLSFISIYVYELPTHHCPFCLLQGAYGGVGYPLYAALLGVGVTGTGVGVVEPFRGIPSLRQIIPSVQRRLTAAGSLSLVAVLAIAAWAIIATNFTP